MATSSDGLSRGDRARRRARRAQGRGEQRQDGRRRSPCVLTRQFAHAAYGKQMTRTKKVKAHNEHERAKTGDTVRIMETRPLSKTNRWRVVEIVEKAK